MIERTRIEGVADAKQRNEIPTPPLKSLNSLAADAVDAADAKIGAFEITENAMCEAFLEFLPNGPVKGIVSAKVAPSWSKTK